ncbi:sugar ABC transporter ATP-binding protein [Extibacter muris]|uniref:sugar ABC transporter ATP-binding protein n=1 Tax=Extibacter muris TaxID=1796622 RepID=UPI001D08F018|nr:sugar ABC transporter ATP-binding protein [Extibacter muris]MCB6203058.1 sugar ABC transporter ATP-binding protein [Extibacter muris]MCQ4664281.1 sugar ABC transporter ATP-binding protein [Extibacter muris]MCQ4695196.1 sugar ABC transporter ATP-binding protein [Extibacter muris]
MAGAEYILEMLDVTKEFPGVKALSNVTIQIKAGEVHGLVGENGAGKSTIMKILAGLYSNDEGRIIFDGEDITKKLNARTAEHLGISFIHQERYVVRHLTVAEMLFLGIEKTKSLFRFMDRKGMVKSAEKMLKEKVGVELPGDRLVSQLTVGEQQLIQICRALMNDPKVIVFDEPTAVLAKKESERLFKIIHQLKKEKGVIYISHYFGEILELCDRVTVLRNGEKIDTVNAADVTIDSLVTMMVGRNILEQYPQKQRKPGETILSVKGLTHKKEFRDLNFQVRRGEILGITGLMGSGHDKVGISIYDNADIVGGEIEFKGKKMSYISPQKAVQEKMGYVPDDRRGLGAIQKMSVQENITLACLKKLARYGIISNKAEAEAADEQIEHLGIRTPGRDAQTGNLSGGNQQKVVLSRWLSDESELYILNQPTSGIDIGARADIYKIIDKMARSGAAVIIITQDIQELYGMSDRVIVMYRGVTKLEMEIRDQDVTNQIIVASMGGGAEDET